MSAIPLLTLAVLPSTINRPPGVYVHGLLLFGLLALFVWGERLDQDDGATVVGVAAVAAAGGDGVRAGAGHPQAVGELPGADQQPGARGPRSRLTGLSATARWHGLARATR